MRLRLVAVASLALLLAGCGAATAATPAASTSSAPKVTVAPSTTAAPTTTVPAGPSTAQLAAKFLQLIAPTNTEADALNAKYPKGFSNTSELTPMVALLTTFDDAVLRIGLTGQAATDARSLVTADATVISDINSSDGAAFSRDYATFSAADNALRADLGLPAASA